MSSLLINHLDVGQGDCTVIMYFDDDVKPTRSILLDCGEGRADSAAYDTLLKHGFKKLDVVLITHYDQDHFIGVNHLLQRASIRGEEGDDSLLRFLSGTKFWDRGDFRFSSSLGGQVKAVSSNNTNYDNYVRLLCDVAKKQRNKGLAPVERMTKNMSRVLPGKEDPNEPVTKEDLQSVGIDEPPFNWARVRLPNKILEEFENDVPKKESVSIRGRSQGYSWVLWKRKSWPIGLDVANFGFANKIDLCIQILVANGYGRVNTTQRDVGDFDENNLGVGYLLEYFDMRYWFGGDLSSFVEDELTNAIGQLSALKAGHHGSSHSTSSNFLSATKPKVVVISTASSSNATVELPHLETLQRLNQSPEVENVYLTGAPYEDPMIPGFDKLYDPSRKFRVAGTPNYPSDISMGTNSSYARGNPKFWLTYHEQNLGHISQRMGQGWTPNQITNFHPKEMPQ